MLIYTGGTIGMIEDPETGLYSPFDFEHLQSQIPEIGRMQVEIDSISFKSPIDSSNMNPVVWKELIELIVDHYNNYDGFVILHGSDTMSYTASALSFALKGLKKPIVLTGSQLPIGVVRTDGKENLITAIEIASDYRGDKPKISEVVIYFEYLLYRGNRTTKYNAEHFEAFRSPNYPVLANAGVHINYNDWALGGFEVEDAFTTRNTVFDPGVLFIRLFPGISINHYNEISCQKEIKGIILHTYGAGNIPDNQEMYAFLKEMSNTNKVMLNVSQCQQGTVDMQMYSTNKRYLKLGIVSGRDITAESAITKFMYLLGLKLEGDSLRAALGKPLCGEMS